MKIGMAVCAIAGLLCIAIVLLGAFGGASAQSGKIIIKPKAAAPAEEIPLAAAWGAPAATRMRADRPGRDADRPDLQAPVDSAWATTGRPDWADIARRL